MLYALIIAGGEGERLRPYTWDRPKPMVPVNGRPILEYQVLWLRSQGVTHIVMLCHYKAEVVQEHFGDGSRFGVHITYTVEPEPLGRGGALRLGYQQVPPDQEVVIGLNGDIITNQRLEEAGIETGVHYPIPLYRQPLYQRLGYNDSLPVAERATQEVLSLPIHPALREEEILYVIETVNTLMDELTGG